MTGLPGRQSKPENPVFFAAHALLKI